MVYAALIFAVVLACVAGVQYFYLMFMETRNRQQQRRIAELERENKRLWQELEALETKLEDQTKSQGELWPELIDEDPSVR